MEAAKSDGPILRALAAGVARACFAQSMRTILGLRGVMSANVVAVARLLALGLLHSWQRICIHISHPASRVPPCVTCRARARTFFAAVPKSAVILASSTCYECELRSFPVCGE